MRRNIISTDVLRIAVCQDNTYNRNNQYLRLDFFGGAGTRYWLKRPKGRWPGGFTLAFRLRPRTPNYYNSDGGNYSGLRRPIRFFRITRNANHLRF